MVMSRKGRRHIVVGERVYWWSYSYFNELRINADDRRLMLLSLQSGEVLSFRVQGPDVRGLPAGTTTPVVIEDTVAGEPVPAYLRDIGPAYVRQVIEWCLDPNAPKRVLSSAVPTSPPDAPASETDFLQPRRPLVSRAIAHAKKLLGAPDGSSVLAVPQNPARARGRRRAVIDALWESLAVGGLLPLAWTSDGE